MILDPYNSKVSLTSSLIIDLAFYKDKGFTLLPLLIYSSKSVAGSIILEITDKRRYSK